MRERRTNGRRMFWNEEISELYSILAVFCFRKHTPSGVHKLIAWRPVEMHALLLFNNGGENFSCGT